MRIDISELATIVRRKDRSATLKSFVVVSFVLTVWINLGSLFEYVRQLRWWGISDVDESGFVTAWAVMAFVTAFVSPLAFIFWDWMVRRQFWRHLEAVLGALIGAVGYAAIGGAFYGIATLILIDDGDESSITKLIISFAIGLLLAALIGWMATRSKRFRLILTWVLALVLAFCLLPFLYIGYLKLNEDLDSVAARVLALMGLAILVAVVCWLFVRAIRHRIVQSGDRPQELLLGAIYRKNFWTRLAFLAGLPSSLWHVSAMKTPAFWAFLLARPLVYAGVVLPFSNTFELLGTAVVISLSMALIVGGHVLFYVGKRLAARYIWNPASPHDPRDPVLFLRSFEDDQLQFKRSWCNIVGRWFDIWSFRRNADEAMIDEIAQYGPVVALGTPGEKKIPFGATRYYSTHEDWQKIVTNTARKSRAIVIGAGDTPGVLWEYELLAQENLLNRTLLLFPPAAFDLSENCTVLEAFANATNVNFAFDIPEDRHLIALLTTDAGPTLLIAREPTAAAYLVAIRAFFQKCAARQLAGSLDFPDVEIASFTSLKRRIRIMCAAADRAVAVLLGVLLQGLKRIGKRLSEYRVAVAVASAIIAAIVIIAIGLYVWELYFRQHINYYRDYVRIRGVWHGIHPIDIDSPQLPARVYRFVRHGRESLPDRVDLLNSSGGRPEEPFASLLGESVEVCGTEAFGYVAQFLYNNDGSILRETILNQNGFEIEKFEYLNDSVARVTVGAFGCMRIPSGLQYVRFWRNEMGYDEWVLFAREEYKLAPNREGVFGYGFERDPRGSLLARVNLGANGLSGWADRNGVYMWRYELDEKGRTTKTEALGPDTVPVFHKGGYAGWHDEFDESGNNIKRSYFGVDGKPVLHKDGYAGWYNEFDERGDNIKRRYFGVDGKPVLHKDGYAGWHDEFDVSGNIIQTSYFDVDGKPALDKNGYAGWHDEFDASGNVIKTSYFGVDGKPVLDKNGYAGWHGEYDERGNVIKVSFFGLDGKPILSAGGVAGMRFEYDKHGNEIKMSFFGMDGKPVLSKYGYAGWEDEVDERGNVIKWSYFGIDGKPVVDDQGVAGEHAEFDERGNEIKRSFFGLDGKPVLDEDG